MKKVLAAIDQYFEETLLCILLLLLSVVMLGDISSRLILGKSIKWAIEFCQYTFVFTSFIAIPYCIRLNSNMKIDVIVSFLPEKVRDIFEIAAELICLVVWSLFLYYAWPVLTESMRHVQYGTTIKVPLYWVYGMPFVVFILAVIREIQSVIRQILHYRKKYSGAADGNLQEEAEKGGMSE